MPASLRNSFLAVCFVAGNLSVAVLSLAAQDKSTTPLRAFTTLQVEDIRFAPELTGVQMHVTAFGGGPVSYDPREAAEAIRRHIVEKVMDRHKFWRVTDVEHPDKVTPHAETEDVRVQRRQVTYGKGKERRFFHRSDFEDDQVVKPVTERILLLRCEIVALQPGGKAKRLLVGAMASRDQVTAGCQLIDKADGSKVSELRVQGTIELQHRQLQISCVDAKVDSPLGTANCYVPLDSYDAVFFGNIGDEVAKAVERGW